MDKADAGVWIDRLRDESVRLVLTDPPYYGISKEPWDNQWPSEAAFVSWLTDLFVRLLAKLTPDGSLVFFGGIGRHGSHPLFKIITNLEERGYQYRNWITWKKSRAFGKSHDYLFVREEIIWFSKSADRTSVVFNKPYTNVLRGYAGFDAKYPALSPYKRVGNVIDDIRELFRPTRPCEKPPTLMKRLIETHSNPGDLVVDPFAGTGVTLKEAEKLGRRSAGCDLYV